MIGQEYRLKADWKPIGASSSAKKLADWMNEVSKQFNNAEVLSGGTARPTAFGMRLEVDSDNITALNLGLFYNEDKGISVYGGSLWRYTSATPIRAELTNGTLAFGSSDEGSVEVMTEAQITASGTFYIYAQQTTLGGTPDVTAAFLTPAYNASPPVYSDNLFLVGVVVTDANSAITIYNALDGDLHLGGGDTPDDISIDRNDAGELQIYNWDNASTGPALAVNDLLIFQDASDSDALKYISAFGLAAYVESAIDHEAFVDPDNVSVDYNTSGKLQLKGWSTAAAASANADPANLIPMKEWSGAVYNSPLEYYTVTEMLAGSPASAINAWELASDYTECYGQSIGSDTSTIKIDLTLSVLKGGDWGIDTGDFNIGGVGKVLKVEAVQVVGARGAAVADATDAASAITQLNALLAELRAATGHGLIA